jgi:hypothetical protein
LKFIRDSLHGNLQLDDFEVRIVDTPQIQRLRRIKQLGFTYLVYPGANHTRFEHSIGTMSLASRLADNLNLDEENKEMLRICGVLHDAGHGPFSHVSEGVLDTSHEKLTSKLIKESQLSDILSERFNIHRITETIAGNGPLGSAISGELDVDRMDYLLRDSYYTGVAYGVIDVERLIYNMELHENIVLRQKGVQAAESMLLARYFMYPSVYQHHTTRIINSMFRKCLKNLFETGKIDARNIYQYDDLDIITTARAQTGYIKDMINKLDNRELFKTVFSLKLTELEDPDAVFRLGNQKIKKIEKELSEDMDIPEGYVLVDVPEYPSFDEMKTQVDVNGSFINLSDLSTIVHALKDARFNYADLCIYTSGKYVKKLSGAPFRDYIEL